MLNGLNHKRALHNTRIRGIGIAVIIGLLAPLAISIAAAPPASALPATTLVLTTSKNPVTVKDGTSTNDFTTITATVTATSNGAPVNSGFVSFDENGTFFSQQPVSNGVVTFTRQWTAGGIKKIHASFMGSASFADSSSNTLAQLVTWKPTTTTVALANGPVLTTTAPTFNVSVTSPLGTPAGKVQLYESGNAIGAQTTLTSGSASIAVPTWPSAGSRSVSAIFTTTTDKGWDTSVGTTSFYVATPTPTFTITPSASSFKYGQLASFNVGVAASAPPSAYSGTVRLYGNGTYLTEGSLDTAGHLTLTTTSLPVGSVTVTAVFGTGGTLGFGSATTTVSVAQWNYSLALTSGPATAFVGDQLTFTATVQAEAGAPSMTGTNVRFTDNGQTYTTSALTGTAPNYTATFQMPATLGDHSFGATVIFPPAAFAAKSTSLVRNIGKRIMQPTLTAGAYSGGAQQLQVTLQEVVSPAAPSSTVPTGNVRLFDNGQFIAEVALSGGTASYSYQSPANGQHEYGAMYMGDATFDGFGTRTPAVVGTDSRAFSSMSVGATSGTYVGDSIVVEVAVTPSTATGTVSFYTAWNYARVEATLDGTGHATATLTGAPAGLKEFYATYLGDANLKPTSGAAASLLNKHFPSITLSNPGGYAPGKPTTLTATLAPQSNDTVMPTGSVVFSVDGSRVGIDVVATNGRATVTTNLPAGTHTIDALYVGDKRNNTSAATITTTSASLLSPTMSVQDVVTGGRHQFVIHVDGAPGQPTPTGTVTATPNLSDNNYTAALAGGVGAIDRITFTQGRHIMRFEYPGDGNYAPAELMSPVVQTEVMPTVTITSNANPAPTSTPVTYTVKVTSPNSGPVPQGDVEIRAPYGLLTTLELDTAGQAQFSVAGCSSPCVESTVEGVPDGLDFLTQPVRAQFLGDVHDGGYGPAAGSLNQHPALATTTSLASSANPSTATSTVTLTATVVGTTAYGTPPTPAGIVTFFDGATSLGTGTLNASGVATLATSALLKGAHSLTAVYGGSTAMAQSTSAALAQTVNGLTSAGTLTTSLNPVNTGTQVIYTATVNGTPAPTGTVTFSFNGEGLLPVNLTPGTNSSTATFPATYTVAGTRTVGATYNGDGVYESFTTTPVIQNIVNATSTALTSSNANTIVSQSTTFTATVTSSSGTPAGTVTFKDGANTIGSAANLNASGVATLSTSALTKGTHSITAVYNGNTTYGTSTSSAFTQTVNEIPTNLTLGSSANPSLRNMTITLTATATSPSGTPSGDVTFKDGATVLGTTTLNGGGVATLMTSALSTGSHSLTAVYAAQGNYGAKTSTAVSQVVNSATPTVVLTSTENPAANSANVTFSAWVPQVSGQPMPDGTFTFIDGTTTLATIPGSVLGSVLIATFTTNSLALGTHPIKVYYSGDLNYAGMNSTVLSQQIKNPTSVELSSSKNPSAEGSSVTFSALVNAPVGGNGTVTFYDDETSIGTGNVTAGNMTATLTTSALAFGTHRITAIYSGDANNMIASSNAVMQRVLNDPIISVTNSSKSPSAFGEAVTFSVNFFDTPTGTVTFKDGATTLATIPITGDDVEYTTSSLSIGTHSISATYNGDDNTMSATALAMSQVVTTVPTQGVVVSSANPSTTGSSVTLTATVSNAVTTKANKPSGTVTFKDGSTTLGTGTLNGTGIATFSTSTLTAGSHGISVSYGGDSTHSATVSSLLIQTVRAPSATSLASSTNPAAPGASVTLTATVTGSGTPSGSVAFKDGATMIATVPVDGASKATFVTSFTVVGTHSLTAVYSGDNTNAPSTSSALSQTIAEPALQTYHPIQAARTLDTQSGVGAAVGKIPHNTVRTLQVTGRNGVPSTGVDAASLTFTIVGDESCGIGSTGGFLIVWPADGTQPNVSNLNFNVGQTASALATVKLSSSGSLKYLVNCGSGSTSAGNGAHLFADVSGWFNTGAAGPGAFTSVTPARLLDTRTTNTPSEFAGPQPKNTNLDLQVVGRGGVPTSGVSAVYLNVTMVTPTGAGFTKAFPTGTAVPNASFINFNSGQTIGNTVIARLSAAGKVTLRIEGCGTSACTSHIVVDVAGYFTSPSGSPSSGAYTALAPARTLDTRTGTGAPTGAITSGSTIALTLTGRTGIPTSGVSAVPINLAVTAPTCSGTLTVWANGTSQPATTNLAFAAGSTISNQVIAPVGSSGIANIGFTCANGASGAVHVIADTGGYFAA